MSKAHKNDRKINRELHSLNAASASVQLTGNNKDWFKIPPRIRTVIKNNGLKRLIQLHNSIANDAQLPMPTIHVIPIGWCFPENGGVVYGMAIPIPVMDLYQWGTVVPASTLVIVDDDTVLRRILCHEFAHCFWYITRILRERKNGEWISIESGKGQTTTDLLNDQLAKDKKELVDPVQWFGEWDAEHFLPEGGEPLANATKLFAQRWILPGLPITSPSMKLYFKGTLEIPDEIEAHIWKLEKKTDST
jgi:hypothetical protein